MNGTSAAQQAPGDDRTTFRSKLRWATQGHVLLAITLMLKLVWFDQQVQVRFSSPAKWMTTLGTVILLTSVLPLLQPRARLLAGIGLNLGLSLVILADVLYFRFFGGLLTFSLLAQADQATAVSQSIYALLKPGDLLIFTDLVIVAVAVGLRGGSAVLRPAGQFRSKRTRELVVFALIIGTTFVVVPVEAQRRQGDAFAEWWDMATYQATGLAGFHAFDAGRFLRGRVLEPEVTDAQVATVREHFAAPRAHRKLPGMPRAGEFAGKNILVIQVEALQSLVIGRSVGGQEITPNLNALIDDSISFPDFRHQTGSGHTSDAELLTGCSLYPAKQGSAFFRFAGNQFRCLPEILDEHGYSSAAHHAYLGSFWNRNTMYPAMGYQKFFAHGDYTIDEPLGWSLGDRSFLRQTVRHLEERPQPFYDVAITLTSHHPYDISNLPPSLPPGELKGTIMDGYLQSIHYVDDALGLLVRQMKQAGLWDETIVIVYGDHDSGIYDRELLERFLGQELGPYELADLRQSVPMFVHLPENKYAGTRVATPTGQVDVPPLLLHLLGLVPGNFPLMGSNRFAGDESPVVFRDGGFVDGEYHYLVDSTGNSRCYDRQAGRLTDARNCSATAERAHRSLVVSDLILEHDLIGRIDGARDYASGVLP